MSKGSAPRPKSVDSETFDDNWERTFGEPRLLTSAMIIKAAFAAYREIGPLRLRGTSVGHITVKEE